MLDEGQEAAQAGDTGDGEAEADDDQGPAPQADSAALAKQMVGEMAGQFGKALTAGDRDGITDLAATAGGPMHRRGVGASGADLGDAFGSVIPEVWRLEWLTPATRRPATTSGKPGRTGRCGALSAMPDG